MPIHVRKREDNQNNLDNFLVSRKTQGFAKELSKLFKLSSS